MSTQFVMIGLAGLAFLIALWLVVVIVRMMTGGRLRFNGGRTRQARLGIVDAFDLDRQRQLIIVRRDNTEHLIMIGGPNDLVIEAEIVRIEARDNRRATDKADGLAENRIPAPAMVTDGGPPFPQDSSPPLPLPSAARGSRTFDELGPATVLIEPTAEAMPPRTPTFPLPRRPAPPPERRPPPPPESASRVDGPAPLPQKAEIFPAPYVPPPVAPDPIAAPIAASGPPAVEGFPPAPPQPLPPILPAQGPDAAPRPLRPPPPSFLKPLPPRPPIRPLRRATPVAPGSPASSALPAPNAPGTFAPLPEPIPVEAIVPAQVEPVPSPPAAHGLIEPPALDASHPPQVPAQPVLPTPPKAEESNALESLEEEMAKLLGRG